MNNSVSCIGISSTNNDHEYPILLKHSSNTNNETNIVNFINDTTNKITANPSTGTITAKFKGDGTQLSLANGETAGVVKCGTDADNIDITNLLECPIKDGKVYYNGTASTATQLANARLLWGNSFDGSADIDDTLILKHQDVTIDTSSNNGVTSSSKY